MHCTKMSTEFEFGGYSPRGAHPKNVAFGYDVAKSARLSSFFLNLCSSSSTLTVTLQINEQGQQGSNQQLQLSTHTYTQTYIPTYKQSTRTVNKI